MDHVALLSPCLAGYNRYVNNALAIQPLQAKPAETDKTGGADYYSRTLQHSGMKLRNRGSISNDLRSGIAEQQDKE